MAEPRKRFSFTEAAAQQPTRQRFSFSDYAPQKKTFNQVMDEQFSARGQIRTASFNLRNPVKKPQTLNEQLAIVERDRASGATISQGPEDSFFDKLRNLDETQPSRLGNFAKEVFQGTVRDVTALLSRASGNKDLIYPDTDFSRFLFGPKPFNTETVGREYADIVGKGDDISAETAGTIGVIGGILSLPGRPGKTFIKGSSKILSKTDDVKLIDNELRRIGLNTESDEVLDFIRVARNETNPKKIEEALTDLVKRGTPPSQAGKRFSFKEAAQESTGGTPSGARAPIRGVTGDAPTGSATRAAQDVTQDVTQRFSFAERARQTPAAPAVRSSTPQRTAPTTRTNITRNKIEADLDEARFINDEVLPQGAPVNSITRKVPLKSRALDTAPDGTNFVKDKVVQVTEPNNQVRIFRVPVEDFEEVKRLVDDGRTADTPIAMGVPTGDSVYHITAKTPEEMLRRVNVIDGGYVTAGDIAEFSRQFIDVPTTRSASKRAGTPVQVANAERAKQITKRQSGTGNVVKDVSESKKWEIKPAETQAQATKEVSKKYSNTDSTKGFVTDAVNHMDNVPPIKNVTAKARNHAKKPNTPIDLPPETLRGWLQTRIQDSAYRLGLVQKNITKAGGKISDEANAYLQREAYIGKAAEQIGRFEKKLGMVAGNKNGLLMRMRKDGITVDQLDEYMRAKAASARNARVASKTGGKVADGGSGLTNKQAQEILDRYKNNPKMQQYADEYRTTAIKPRLQVLKEAGILTDEQIALITKGEPDYVPFKVEEFSRPQGGGKGFSVTSSGVKGLKGSARTDRTNAVFQGAVDYQEAVIQAEKNKSLQALAKLIRENPDSSLWEIKGVQYTPNYNKYGEVEFLRKNPINEKTSVEFFENGKAYEIRFHDEALARVFTEQGLTKPIPGLIKINNYLRAVNTVINPEFMITNALRDLQTAIVTAGGEKGSLLTAKMVKDYPQASKGIWQAVRKESNTGWAKVYNEMVENGGRTGWFDLKEVGETTKEVSKRIERYNSTKTSDSLMRAIDSTGKLISDANEIFEMSIRTSAYKQLVDGGMSKTAAANYAKNMTVNFNKRGNWGMTLNSAYLFANAGIQGSARILMAMKYPKVRRIVYGIVATSYGLNELNMKINPEGYERIQDFEKERNLIIMLPLDGNKYNIPGIEGDPGNGYYLKMPLPYGFNVFKVAGDAAYDTVNKKKTTGEAMVQMIKAIDASFNPLSSGTPTQFITPTFLDPFVSSWENKNWFGAPIMPEQPAFAPAVRDSDRYFSGARDISVGTAQFLNRLTGGNEVTSGAVDISPETIDHVIDTLGGGLGNFVGQTVDGSINVVKGDVPTPDEMPFVRKLIDTPFETGEQSQVFELLERSATQRMSAIEINRFIDNTKGALERGQIDDATGKRVIKDFLSNAARQEAGEVLSLIQEGKIEEAKEVIANAPPGISKELNKLIEDDVEREIKKLKRELQQ